jgi:DNA-binding response OmpR family regulator
VSQHPSPASTQPDPLPSGGKGLRVLVVDGDMRVGQQVSGCMQGRRFTLAQVTSVSEALKHINKSQVDLVLIETDLSDGSALALARRLREEPVTTHAIMMTDQPNYEGTLEAMRSGAVDVITKPLDADEARKRIEQARVGLLADRKQQRRVKRLQKVCKKLSRSREEIAHQVDILCNDLVIAYQELAQQVHTLSHGSEFAGLINHELDLEALLRRTLEFLLQKAGSTNVAIFLPASTDPGEYSLGGYVNYECSSESAEILLEHLADALAPKMVGANRLVHITENQELSQWLGDDLSFLTDSHLVAFPCHHEDETLAVVVLFRHETQPFGHTVVQTCNCIAPVLAETLAKVVRVHHRLAIDDEDIEPMSG